MHSSQYSKQCITLVLFTKRRSVVVGIQKKFHCLTKSHKWNFMYYITRILQSYRLKNRAGVSTCLFPISRNWYQCFRLFNPCCHKWNLTVFQFRTLCKQGQSQRWVSMARSQAQKQGSGVYLPMTRSTVRWASETTSSLPALSNIHKWISLSHKNNFDFWYWPILIKLLYQFVWKSRHII